MRYSNFCQRIGGEGAKGWETHYDGLLARQRGEPVLLLSVGDPDFDTPKHIVDEAVASLHGGDTHYTYVEGREELRAAVATRMNKRTPKQYNASNITITAGCQNALYCTAAVLLEPGDEVIVFDPTYVTYEATLGATGATVVAIPCPASADFRPDIAAIQTAITSKTRAIFLVSPVNPTGVVFNKDELMVIADLAIEHDLWLVSDEVYSELVFEGECLSIASLPNMAERTVTVSSLSKSHAMTGWRTGWAIGPVEFSSHMANLALCMTYGLPGFIQQAALTAIVNGDDDTTDICEVFKQRRNLLLKELKNLPGVRCHKPQAGMFIMLDVTATGLSSAQFVHDLYQQQKVTTIDGKAFGASADGSVRLAFTLSESELLEACKRIRQFVASLENKT